MQLLEVWKTLTILLVKRIEDLNILMRPLRVEAW